VFEGVFEKIFSIIREEGYSDGGVVVQVIIWDHCDLFFEDFFFLLMLLTCNRIRTAY
jgi:hypothetical protein